MSTTTRPPFPPYLGTERRVSPDPGQWGIIDRVTARILAFCALLALVLSVSAFLGIDVTGSGAKLRAIEPRLSALEANTHATLMMTCYLARKSDPKIVQPECTRPAGSPP